MHRCAHDENAHWHQTASTEALVDERSAGARRSLALRMLAWPAARLVDLLLLLIRFYQRLLSPALGGRCRFSPSCSEYAAESLKKHGLLRGLFRSTWRILRCNPFGGSGYDPP